jgi:lipoprotein-anchoring transpeptidase ErfK/SrfK
MHYSQKYDNSPMPNSIFFLGGYAIHGTYYVKNLGRPASHGCIRLSPGNAAKLYGLVKRHGLGATRITITN